RELSSQLGERGWQSVLCFLGEPTDQVRDFINLPNVSFEVFKNPANGKPADGMWTEVKNVAGIISRHRPEILHLHFTGFLSLYPWLGRLQSVRQVFFTDHHSRESGYIPARAGLVKRSAARFINQPLNRVISVSNYGRECMVPLDLLPEERYQLIYNGVDLSR